MTSHSRKPRLFKSAEKPVSLYPLSYKQALEALLRVGPVSAELAADQASPDPVASGRKVDSAGS